MAQVPDSNQRYTYADLLRWGDDMRWEIIAGAPYAMAPAPTPEHQDVSETLEDHFRAHFRDKSCRAHHAPRDLALFVHPDASESEMDTVVQPDIFVLCHEFRIGNCIAGDLRLVVEILSPSSVRHDKVTKLNLYERAGVPEYWIVDPLYHTIEVYELENESYLAPRLYTKDDILSSVTFPEFSVGLESIF